MATVCRSFGRSTAATFVVLLALFSDKSDSYGATRRRRIHPSPAPFSPPQPKPYRSRPTQVPVFNNCSAYQIVQQPTPVLPHTHITRHVTPVVRTHVHQQPPVEVVRTTKTIYQPPPVVHRTVDYEHHDHITTHYSGAKRPATRNNYYPTKVPDTRITARNRKALEVHHDGTHRAQNVPHRQRHHDDHAHFGPVPTGNAIVTSYFNFPGDSNANAM